jgi:hypothetical protein
MTHQAHDTLAAPTAERTIRPTVGARVVTGVTDPAPAAPRTRRAGFAATSALLATLSTYAVLAVGLLPVLVVLALLVLLLVAVPTAGGLSRRVALNGSLLIGWAQVLWWVRWPVPVNHGAAILAATTGCLVLLLHRAKAGAARSLVPRARPGDVLIASAGLAATVAMSPWAFAGSSRRALTLMLPGADNYAHFHMFATIRTYGAVTTSLPSPDGRGWGFDEYPQGFHALAATLSELVQPQLRPGVALPLAYVHAVSLVVLLGVVTLVAAIVSLPGVRNRPSIALPVVTITLTAFLWKPGQDVLADGFANFWLAATAAASALLIGMASRCRLSVPESVAVVGLIVLVAHAWAPMVVIAGPAALAVLSPLRPFRGHADPRRRAAVVAVTVLGALGVLEAVVALFTHVDVGTLVTAIGGVHGANPLPPFVLLIAGAVACWRAPKALRRHGQEDAGARVKWVALALLAGFGLGAVLLAAQFDTIGTSSYYFLKFFLGFDLILAAVVPALWATVLANAGRISSRRWVGVLTCLAMTAAASQAFGRFPAAKPPLSAEGRDGTASVGRPFDAARIADGILAAAASSTSTGSVTEDYVAIGPDRAAQAFYPDGWYHGVLASLTAGARQRLDYLRVRVDTVNEAVPVVRRLLERRPEVHVIVAARYARALRTGLRSTNLQARVRSWDQPPLDEAVNR